jgi:chromosome partitioning protein
MRRIAFINEKGGTCKTTLCVNVAARLAARGLRVLVADLDTQGHAAKSLGVDPRRLSPTVHEWLLGGASFAAVVRRTPIPGLDLLPANKDLAAWPQAAGAAGDGALHRRLAELPPDVYDVVLLDSPPSRSLVTDNILHAAGEIVIPVALTYLALDGCAEILESLERLRAERGAAPTLTLVVPTLYRKTQLADEILARLRSRLGPAVCGTVLGWSVKIDEAQSHGQTIFEWAPRSPGARALAAIADEILHRGVAPSGASPSGERPPSTGTAG